MSENSQIALSRDAERRVFQERRLQEEAARRKRMNAGIARAKAAGFTDRQAPFAAMAFETFRATRGEPTAAQVRDRVRHQYPWLFDELTAV